MTASDYLYRFELSKPLLSIADYPSKLKIVMETSNITATNHNKVGEYRMVAINPNGTIALVADHGVGLVYQFDPREKVPKLKSIFVQKQATSIAFHLASEKRLQAIVAGESQNIR